MFVSSTQSIALQNYLPPAAIGSSSDCVTGGGKIILYFAPRLFRIARSTKLPAARGDRFLIRLRHGRRQ
jgi:hypothetical protein